MKKVLITLISILFISTNIYSRYILEIEITGIRNNTGVIMLQLLDENQNPVIQEKGIIKDQKSNIIIRDLKPAKYAIRYFHDENMNGEMEKNRIGKPTEGYGFSNDAYGIFGPRPFKEWLFDFRENRKIILKIKY